MKEIDMAVVANMTVDKLIENIRSAKPDSKDLMRASDIWLKKPGESRSYERMKLANLQLTKITDTNKFYRRAHAFLSKGIDCSLCNTIFTKCNTVEVKDFIKVAQQVGLQNRKIEKALECL